MMRSPETSSIAAWQGSQGTNPTQIWSKLLQRWAMSFLQRCASTQVLSRALELVQTVNCGAAVPCRPLLDSVSGSSDHIIELNRYVLQIDGLQGHRVVFGSVRFDCPWLIVSIIYQLGGSSCHGLLARHETYRDF